MSLWPQEDQRTGSKRHQPGNKSHQGLTPTAPLANFMFQNRQRLRHLPPRFEDSRQKMVAVTVEKEKSPHKTGLSQGVEFCFHLKCKGRGRCPRQAGQGARVVADGAPTQTLTGEKMPHRFSRDAGVPALLEDTSDNTARAFRPANDCFWTIFSGGNHYHRVQEPCQPRGAPTDTCAHRPAAFRGHGQAQPPRLLARDLSLLAYRTVGTHSRCLGPLGDDSPS